MTTEKFLVLDTETCGEVNVADSFCYDIGFIVADFEGNIYEKHSYAIADYFLDDEMMSTAYYKEKMPIYEEEIKNGTRKLRRLSTVRSIIYDVCRQYNITKMFAYNVRFDVNAMLNSQRLSTCSKYRYFLPRKIQPMDILTYGRALAKSEDYKNFCREHNYLTANNRAQTKAEVVARYLFDEDFIEEHRGLEDCEIEYKILLALIKVFGEMECSLYKE